MINKFKVGDECIVTKSLDDTFNSAWENRSIKIVHLDIGENNFATVGQKPNDPFYRVVDKNGNKESFWAEEMELINNE